MNIFRSVFVCFEDLYDDRHCGALYYHILRSSFAAWSWNRISSHISLHASDALLRTFLS